MDLTLRIGAAAGGGAFVTGRVMGKLFSRGGFYVFGYPEYPSLVRGGHNTYQIRVSDKPVFSPRMTTDVLVAMNKEAVMFHKDSLSDKAVVIVDEHIPVGDIRDDVIVMKVPTNELLGKADADPKMKNTLYVGISLGLIGYPLEIFEKVLDEEFSRKGKEVVDKNVSAARVGYEFAKSKGINFISVQPIGNPKIYIGGNEAAGVGAISAGLKFYSAYPMTPASSLMHYLEKVQYDTDITVVQAEDEIAAINFAVGAAFAGVRAMTGTSGGGFALMTETVGMAALAETPLVVYIAQRVGPSTGMPTWTEQADLFQVLGASQGEFLRVVLAPTDIEDIYSTVGFGLNIAEKYQLPVFILTDKFIAESQMTVDEMKPLPIERGKMITGGLPELKPNERFKRYAITDDGVSPRTFPGVENGMHVATSYEHREDSFTTEDFDERVKQVDKRARKLNSLLKDALKPKVYGDKDAEIALVTWGSQKGPALHAIDLLKEKGISAKLVAFNWVYPLTRQMIEEAVGNSRTIVVENNSTALFYKLVKQETGFEFNHKLLKYTGRQFFPEQIVKGILNLKESDWSKDEVRYKEDFEKYEFYAPWRYV